MTANSPSWAFDYPMLTDHPQIDLWTAAAFNTSDEIETNVPVDDPELTRLYLCCPGDLHRLYGMHGQYSGEVETDLICPECGLGLFGPQLIVSTGFGLREAGEPNIRRWLMNVWDDKIWSGSVGGPRISANEIASVWVDRFSDEWGWDWMPTCPVCGVGDPKFDFHHWDYEQDIGVCLCRECHEYIHDGKTATDQARGSPDGDWRQNACERLVRLHQEHHGEIVDWEGFNIRYQLHRTRTRVPNAIANQG